MSILSNLVFFSFFLFNTTWNTYLMPNIFRGLGTQCKFQLYR
jgi:hypothetical protein